jgi:hypothetical protein
MRLLIFCYFEVEEATTDSENLSAASLCFFHVLAAILPSSFLPLNHTLMFQLLAARLEWKLA